MKAGNATKTHTLDERVDEILGKMTLQEKVSLLAGQDRWRTVPIERLAILSIFMTDGPHGVWASEGERETGRMEVVRPDLGFVVIAPDGRTRALSLRMAHDILNLGGQVLLITNRDDYQPHPRLRVWLSHLCDEHLSPIIDLVRMQLLAYELGLRRGLQPGVLTKAQHISSLE